MIRFYVLYFGPLVVAAAVALLWWRARARGEAAPGGALRIWTIAAVAIPLLVIGARQVLGFPLLALRLPPSVLELIVEPWFVWPLVLGLIALVLLLLPPPVGGTQGAVEVSRRTMWTFAPVHLLLWFGVLLAVVLVPTVAAGLASEPDDVGRYRMYWVHNGNSSMGTEIYGWYHSVPALVLLGLIVVLVLVALAFIARPRLALGEERARDVALRRLRSRNVLLVAIGAGAAHLSAILGSLANTASVRSSFSGGDVVVLHMWTPIAALTTALMVAGAFLLTVALTAWLAVLLSMVPRDSSRRTTADLP